MKKLFVVLLLSFFFQVSAQENSSILIEKAQEKAKKESKAIFIKFEASWCGWCHKMTKDMKAEGTKKIFEENYVVIPLVVKESPQKKNLENPGSLDILTKYEGDKAGLPFWVILDSNLKVITNSYDSKNQNLGGPGTPEEVEEFIKKVKMSAKNFTEKDANAIIEQFTLKR